VPDLGTTPAVFEIGLILLLAVAAGWLFRRQLAVGLGQVGEFSFVLATIVLGRSLIPAELFTAILTTVVLTIAASTVLVRLGTRVALASEAEAAT
jgi:Kef-type K+ transport system membrane component KefB